MTGFRLDLVTLGGSHDPPFCLRKFFGLLNYGTGFNLCPVREAGGSLKVT